MLFSKTNKISAGFNDPFFYYYRCTFIGNRREINGFTLKQLINDEKWGGLSIVRKNMQGVNGVEIKPSLYNYLLDKCNVINLEKIQYSESVSNSVIQNEHDVEIKILESILDKLGWKKSDYITQMTIKLGSGRDRLIPDYVIQPVEIPRHESAMYVVEVKKSINNASQREEAIGQVRSYARQLKAKKCMIISQESL